MRAFKISFNGQEVLTAGFAHHVAILHAVMEIHGGLLDFIVRGRDAVAGQTCEWDAPQPKLGDKYTIEIVETDQISPESRKFSANIKFLELHGHQPLNRGES